jgi:hypothetical protein
MSDRLRRPVDDNLQFDAQAFNISVEHGSVDLVAVGLIGEEVVPLMLGVLAGGWVIVFPDPKIGVSGSRQDIWIASDRKNSGFSTNATCCRDQPDAG